MKNRLAVFSAKYPEDAIIKANEFLSGRVAHLLHTCEYQGQFCVTVMVLSVPTANELKSMEDVPF